MSTDPRNDKENDENLKKVINRFLEILFNIGVHTPSKDEAGMYSAVAAANKSACMSRQVGASIYSGRGELVSIGWNDVPKAAGGLYEYEDGSDDKRCFKWKGKICHNDDKKEALYTHVYDALKGLLAEHVTANQIRTALTKTPIRNLIEYSRSIHAEMEAIVSAARTGKVGIVGGSLYTTTFPCHNCARHIVAAGIENVYYIEPYSKSLALELHSDSISTKLGIPATQNREGRKMVSFLQYEGVGPESMLKLFQNGVERKVGGKLIEGSKKTASPVTETPIDGFTTHEILVISRLTKSEVKNRDGVL
jgi:deoxycytidylate deaminase